LLSNVRSPRPARGDFMAMYGSLATAESRLGELVERYGKDALRFYFGELQKYAERRMRAEIREIPNGIYRATIFADDDGVVPDRPYRINVAVSVADEDIVFDFRGSDEQARGPINCPHGVTLSGAANAVFNLVDYTIPHNQGIFRPLHFRIPPRSMLNCEYPAPLAAGNTEIHNLIAEACQAAFAEAIPKRTIAPTGATTALITGGGVHPESGDFYTFVIWEPVGWGGRRNDDGNDAIVTWVGPRAKNFPTEVLETQIPWRITRYQLRQDSGGPGRHRGGLGIEREYCVLGEGLAFNATGHFGVFRPRGFAGGQDAAETQYRVRVDGRELSPPERTPSVVSPIKFSAVSVDRDEAIVVRSPGGGGYGDAAERDRDSVLEDLKNGYISERSAVDDYGLDRALARATVTRYWWPVFLTNAQR
jgi:N-methylhydantoinase B